MNSHELKGFQSKLSQLLEERRKVNISFRETRDRISALDGEIEELKSLIARASNRAGGVIVSEHAMLRYLERVQGVDLEALKRSILGCDPTALPKGASGSFPVSGHVIKLTNGVVTTVVVPGKDPHPKKGGQRGQKAKASNEEREENDDQ